MWNDSIANCANEAVTPPTSSDICLSELISQIYELVKCNRDMANKISETMYGSASEKTEGNKRNVNSAFIHLLAIQDELLNANDILHYILNRM